MQKNRILRLVLTLVLTMALATSWASAATFSDIDTHWSKSYVEDVADQGLVNGYSDGTFRPDNTMTYYEALLFCSRVAGLSDDVAADIAEKWFDEMIEILPSSISGWAYIEMAACVELGIISLDELEDISDSGDILDTITRQELTLYLTRAMQLDALAESLTSYSTSFGDSSSISSQYLPYIYLLNSSGIIQGDDEGNFNPKNTLTRGEMAALLSRTLDLMESQGILVELADYNSYSSWFGGTISSATTTSTGVTTLVLTSEVSGTKSIVIPLSAQIYDFNVSTNYTALTAGDYARVNYNSSGVVTSVVVGGTTESNSGTIISLSEDSITLWGTGGYKTYDINYFTEVSTGLQSGGPSIIDLSTDYTSAQCTVNQMGQLTALTLQGGTQVVDGIFSATQYDSYGTLGIQMTGLDGMLCTYPAADGMTITVDGVSSNFLYSSLSGDYIILYLDNDTGEVQIAQVDTATTYIQGAIKSYDEDDDPPTIIIKNLSTSKYTEYDVEEDAPITLDGEEIDMDDMEIGWFVTALYDDDSDEILQIWCTTGSYYESGTLTDIVYGVTTTLEIALSDGTSVTYSMDMTDPPTIYRDDSSSSIDKLRTGDYLEIEVEYNEVAFIEATSQSANLTGTISSITKTTSGTTIEVELASGYSESYTLSSSISVTWDDDDVSASSLEVGYDISMVVVNGQVVSIQVDGTPTSSNIITGTLLYKDSSADTFLINLDDSSNTLVTVDVDDANFYNSSTGSSTTSSKFTVGASVQVYGSYSDNIFYATMVILQ